MKRLCYIPATLLLIITAATAAPASALECPSVESYWPYGPGLTAETWTGGGEELLLAGSGSALKIFDVSDPTAMVEIGEIAVSDPIWHIDIEPAGDLVAVSDRGKWVHLVDISNRAAPVELGRYEVEDGRLPYGVAFAGDHLAVAVGPAGLWMLDVSDPAAPSLAGQYIEPGTDFVFDVEVLGDHAFVADDDDGVTVIDISDPAMPTMVGRFTGATDASHITIEGNRAYVSRRAFGFQILDLTMPTMPALVGSYPDFAYRTEVAGNYAVVAGINGTEVVDISMPATPVKVGTVGNDSFSLAVLGQAAFTLPPSSFMPELEAIDFSTPAAPSEVDSVELMHDSRNVEIAGDVGLVANGSRGLVTIDLTATGTLATLGRHQSDNVRSVAAVGTHAIVANFSNSLPIIDFSDPAAPSEVATASITGSSYDVKTLGNLAYVAANNGGLRIVDLSTPTAPNEIGFLVPSGGGGTAVSVKGTTAFLTSNVSGWVIDVSDPTMPMEIATFSLPATSYDSDVEGDQLYVATQNGVSIFDMSNPSSPNDVAFYSSSPTSANGVDVVGDRLYIAADTYWGLLVVDVSDPTDPQYLDDIGTPGAAERVVATAQRILIADGDNGARLLACEADPPLFADGFESGDTTSWSSIVP